jgi:hypothetical protein
MGNGLDAQMGNTRSDDMAVVVMLRAVTETEAQTHPIQRLLDEVAIRLANDKSSYPGLTAVTLQIKEEED